MQFKAKIFTPEYKKSKFLIIRFIKELFEVYSIITYLSMALGMLLLYLSNLFLLDSIPKDLINATGYILLLFTPLVILTKSYFTKENLKGTLSGSIEIYDDVILFNDIKLNINQIKSIEIDIEDYAGRSLIPGTMAYSSTLSQGVDNKIRLTTIEGKDITVYFQLDNKNHKDDLLPFIDLVTKKRILPFLRGISLLGIKGYANVQEYKKSVYQ